MASTYKQLVNAVLSRLRETQLGASDSISDDLYWSLIANFVNDAKREIEDSHNWTDFRTTLELTTTSGSRSLVLTGTTSRSKILSVWDTTNQVELIPIPHSVYNQYVLGGTIPSQNAMYYRRRGVDATGAILLELYPTPPNSSTTIKVYCTTPQADLAADATELALIGVEQAIIYKAWAYAISERGEDGGMMFDEVTAQARKFLADAIQIDCQGITGEFDWIVD